MGTNLSIIKHSVQNKATFAIFELTTDNIRKVYGLFKKTCKEPSINLNEFCRVFEEPEKVFHLR